MRLFSSIAICGALLQPILCVGQASARSHPSTAAASDALQHAEQDLDRNQFSTAAAALEPYVAAHPQDARAHMDLAFAYSGLSRNEDAIREYQAGLKSQPDNFAAQLNLGILLVREHRPQEALAPLQAAQKLRPTNAKVWLNQGRALEKLGDRQRAVEAYEKAATLDPNNAEARISAGILLTDLKRYAEAETQLKSALTLDPGSKDAEAALINVYVGENRGSDAEQLLKTYLARDPNSAPAHQALARIYIDRGNLVEGMAELTALLQLEPANDIAREELAQLQLKTKHYADAAETYRLLLVHNPRSAEWHYGRASALLMQQQFEPARQELLAALSINPDLAQAWGDLALVFYKLKDPTHTLEALDRRSRLKGDDAGSYFLRAITYDGVRDYRNAIANYEKFLQVDQNRSPDDEFKARHRLVTLRHILNIPG